jgi:uncharacterized RDD family membrane protein YckC
MFCPRCGREAQSGATYCVYCGATLDTSAAPTPVVDPSPAVAATVAVTAAPALAPAPAAVRYAGFWRRFVAFWIDAILLWIASAILTVSMGGDLFERDFGSPQTMLANFISLVVGWLYSALLESGPRQATLGQMVIGIQVTDLGHRRISFARATGRHFAQIISAVILCVGYIMIAFTEKKQGLHDMMAGCLVVRAAE